MAAVRALCGILCIAFVSSFGQLNRHLLTPEDALRMKVVKLAMQELGVRERTGRNDGKRIEEYLRYIYLKAGQPYCAAFVSWAFHEAGFSKPRSGWSPDLFPKSKLTKSVLPGNVLGLYFSELKRIAHVGLVIRQDGDWVVSLEANTNVAGSREGDGVYLKRRHVRTISKFADWIKNERKLP